MAKGKPSEMLLKRVAIVLLCWAVPLAEFIREAGKHSRTGYEFVAYSRKKLFRYGCIVRSEALL